MAKNLQHAAENRTVQSPQPPQSVITWDCIGPILPFGIFAEILPSSL